MLEKKWQIVGTKCRMQNELTSSLFNPLNVIRHFLQYRDLIGQFTWREVVGRYKGSSLGLAWAFIQPLAMLAVYTFVFSIIFEAKWGMSPQEGKLGFAMALFVGILTFNILGDVVSASPGLILGNANYVKKVIFPLEILPLVKLFGAVIHSFFGMVILVAGIFLSGLELNWTIILLPVVWLPVMLFSLGWGYFLSSIAVFVRDVGQSVGLFVTMLFFLSPIFYPLKAVPESLRIYCQLNPIAIFVEDARRVVLWGTLPDWPWFFAGLAISFAIFYMGFFWFMRSKKAFADVM